MAKVKSLHIGLNAVDPASYGAPFGLTACEADARDMRRIAKARGAKTKLLLTADATCDAVLEAIDTMLPRPEIRLELLIPYDRGDLIPILHEQGKVLALDYAETGTLVTALVSPGIEAQFTPFVVVPAIAG